MQVTKIAKCHGLMVSYVCTVDLLLTRYFLTLCKDPASTLSVTDCKGISMAKCCAANLRCSSNNMTA